MTKKILWHMLKGHRNSLMKKIKEAKENQYTLPIYIIKWITNQHLKKGYLKGLKNCFHIKKSFGESNKCVKLKY